MLKYIYNLYKKNNIDDMLNHNIVNKYNKVINFNSEQIKLGNYARVKKYETIVVKTFESCVDYLNEKVIYTTKLPQYGGCLYKENNKYIYEYNDQKIIIEPIYKDGMMIINDPIVINNIIKLSSKHIDKIIILNYGINIITNVDSNEIIIGFCIKKDKCFNIYINSFKIMRLLQYDDINNSLYYENLGSDLKESFINNNPSYEQRIFMAIDLIRQLKELIDICVYHNDVKNDNIALKYHNSNYYINLIDYGLSITINDLLKFEYLTSPTSASPEYYIINTLLQNRKNNIICLKNIFPNVYKKYENNKNISTKDMKELLDQSLHWAIGAMIINILSWKDVQSPIWHKHYNSCNYNFGVDISYIDHLNTYSSHGTAFNYTREMLCELFKNEYLYEDIFYFSSNDMKSLINTINKFSDYELIMSIIDDRFKEEYLSLIIIIYNLFEFSPDKKMSLSDMYDRLKDYPGYQKYLNSKPTFL